MAGILYALDSFRDGEVGGCLKSGPVLFEAHLHQS